MRTNTLVVLGDLRRLLRGRRATFSLIAVVLVPALAVLFQLSAHDGGEVNTVRAAVVNEDKIATAIGPGGKKMPVAVGRLLAGNLSSDTSSANFDWVITNRKDADTGLRDGTYGAVLTIPSSVSSAAISTAGDNPRQATIQIQTNDATSYLNGQIARAVGRAATNEVNETVTSSYLSNLYIGFGTIKSSVKKASSGANELSTGAAQLAGGAAELDGGIGTLSSGLSQLADKTSTLPTDSGKLSEGATQLADGSAKLSDGSTQLASGTDRLVVGLNTYAAGMDQLVANCPALILFQRYCDGVAQARDGAKQIAQKSTQLRDGATGLANGTAQLAGGAKRLSDGTDEFASQAPQLSDAIAQAASGATQLKSGSAQLATGAIQVAGGADQLQGGLSKGADQVPTYSAGQREKLSKVVASPVSAKSEQTNSLASAEQARIPYMLALGLFLGALAMLATAPLASVRLLASAITTSETLIRRYLIVWAIAAVQVAAALTASTVLTDAGVAHPARFALTALIASLAFTSLVQGAMALLGRAGVYFVIGWLFVQVLTVDPNQPVQALSGIARIIHVFSPLRATIEGLQGAQAGGGAVTGPIIQLLVWTTLAICMMGYSIHRHRMNVRIRSADGSTYAATRP